MRISRSPNNFLVNTQWIHFFATRFATILFGKSLLIAKLLQENSRLDCAFERWLPFIACIVFTSAVYLFTLAVFLDHIQLTTTVWTKYWQTSPVMQVKEITLSEFWKWCHIRPLPTNIEVALLLLWVWLL